MNIVARYLIRVVKYFIYFAIIILAMMALVYYTSDHNNLSFFDLIRPDSQRNLLIFLIAFSLAYPFIGFQKKEVPMNRAFDLDKDAIVDMIKDCGYKLVSDTNQKLVFRPDRLLTRILRVFEDKMTIDYSQNPLVLDGMRKDVVRFARHMEYHFRRSEE